MRRRPWPGAAIRRAWYGARLRWLRRHLGRRVPSPVMHVWDRLVRDVSPQTYLVGGCVRDLLLGRPVRDWDFATAAHPEAVAAAFARTIPTGLAHGTLTVLEGGAAVEVTTFRREGAYLDGRRPSTVSFDADLEADLARRDFTINAMALGHPEARNLAWLNDPHRGLQDLAERVVRAVGDPEARFAEDALRLMRVYRIAAELDFDIAPATAAAATATSPRLRLVSAERIRAELDRILVSGRVAWCLEALRLAGAIDVVLPELAAGAGFAQNEYHPHDVWQHSVLACAAVAPVLHLRLAALLHDVGKPPSLGTDDDGRRHFYGHEHLGAEVAASILKRLRYDRDTTRRVLHLIRVHMDFHDLPPEAGDGAIRRAAARVGREHLGDLLRLRHADRLASGKSGPVSPGTLQMLKRLAELERADEALTIGDLRIDGHELMRAMGLEPGPEVGRLLAQLLEAVVEEPALNTKDQLIALAKRLRAR